MNPADFITAPNVADLPTAAYPESMEERKPVAKGSASRVSTPGIKKMQRGLLRNPADVRTVGILATYFALVLALWHRSAVMPYYVSVPIYALVLVLAMSGGTIVHNALHLPLFYSKNLNTLFQIALTFLFGHPVTLLVPVHNLAHHKHTQAPEDLLRSTKLRSKWNLLNCLQATQAGIRIIIEDFKFFKVQRAKNTPIWRQFRVEFALVILYGLTLLYMAPLKWFVFIFIPQNVSQGFILAINFVWHDGCDDDQEGYNHSRNFTGRMFNWIFLNNGFHTIHHRKPYLHWARAKEEHDKTVHPYIHPNLEIEDAFGFSYKYLINPGTRVTYLGEPYDPPECLPDAPWFFDDLADEDSKAKETKAD